MTVVPDWMLKAAERIEGQVMTEHLRDPLATIRAIIAEECPFKPDTAYVEVSRVKVQVICRVCRDTMPLVGANDQGATFDCPTCRATVVVRLKV